MRDRWHDGIRIPFVRLVVPLLILAALALPAALLAAEEDDPPAPPPAPTGTPQPLPPVATTTPQPLPPVSEPEPLPRSRAAGVPWRGRLVNGRQLPLTGPGFATWDPIL